MRRALLLVTALAGCISFSVGRKFDAAHVSDIRTCVTTAENLLAWFGEPYLRGSVDGLPTLQWFYAKGTAGSRLEQQSLVVIVNRAGRVLHYEFNPTCLAMEAKDICGGAGDAPAHSEGVHE